MKWVIGPTTLYIVARTLYEPEGMRPPIILVPLLPNRKNLGFFSVLRFTNLFWLLNNSETTVTLRTTEPTPQDTTASMLVLLHGGKLDTTVPLFSVVIKVSVMELYKSHRVKVHLLTVGVETGAFTGVFVGDFVGFAVGRLIGFLDGTLVGATMVENVAYISKFDVPLLEGTL